MVSMNRLDNTTRAQVVKCLCDGNSIRATVRITGVAKNTVVKLLCDLGAACAEYHHENVCDLRVRRLQCDEIWSFIGSKAKNTSPEKKQEGCGDAWTWTAIDADTKLIVSYLVGGRDAGWALDFMQDCADRIKGRVQVTTDGHKAYLEAVEGAFGMSMRRFTRLTNGFSKKIENHIAAVALYFMYYNFCRVHQTLRVTPAMEAGIANHVWTIEELSGLLQK
jgi:IS1 family transposase